MVETAPTKPQLSPEQQEQLTQALRLAEGLKPKAIAVKEKAELTAVAATQVAAAAQETRSETEITPTR